MFFLGGDQRESLAAAVSARRSTLLPSPKHLSSLKAAAAAMAKMREEAECSTEV